jgi:hypothetical protein
MLTVFTSTSLFFGSWNSMTKRNSSLGAILEKVYVQPACHVTNYGATFGIDKDELNKKAIVQNALSLIKSEDAIVALGNVLISISRDRNWLEFLSVLDATLPRQVSSSHSEQSRRDVEANITHSKALFSKVAEEDGLKDRSGFLALLELEKRSVAHGHSKGGYDPTFSGVLFVDRVRQIQVGWPRWYSNTLNASETKHAVLKILSHTKRWVQKIW